MKFYRPEIDGLRAIAVLPVVLFHAGVSIFSGGYVGVDIFFVISGYLITSILISDLEKNKFSILNFYERRARRILPALFFVMLATLPFSLLYLFPVQYKDYSQSLVAVSWFVSNFLFWKESGYFEEASEDKPLIHTWSLAVEEQYYIFFPILLFFLWKNRSFLVPILLIITLLSLSYAEYGSKHFPSSNFFLFPSRIWELMIGSLAAIYLAHNSSLQKSNILTFIGFLLIGYSIFVFDSSTRFPSLYALAPVIGSLLIILFCSKDHFFGKVLSVKPFLFIGLISYSLYLWHQPIFAFIRLRSIAEPPLYLMLMGALFSILLAYISWRFVEQPFRAKHNSVFAIGRSKIFKFSIVGMIAFSLLGLFGQIQNGLPQRYESKVLNIIAERYDVNPHGDLCHFRPIDFPTHPIKNCLFKNDTRSENKVALLGDSHAKSLHWAIQNQLRDKNISLYVSTYEACPPIRGILRMDYKESKCDLYNSETFKYLEQNNFNTYILSARWSLYILGEMFNNQEGGVELGSGHHFDLVEYSNLNSPPEDQKRMRRVVQAYVDEIEKILDQGKKIILIDPVPEAGWHVPDTLAKLQQYTDSEQILSTSFELYKERNQFFIDAMETISNQNFIRIKPQNILCSEKTNRCVHELDERVLYFDDDHLNNKGAELISSILEEYIKYN